MLRLSWTLYDVLKAIERGANYSSAIGKKLGYSQEAAQENLKRLEKIGAVSSFKQGVIVRYKINRNRISPCKGVMVV